MRLCLERVFLCSCVTKVNVKHPLAGYQNVQIILMWTKGCSKLEAHLNSEW